MCHAASHSSAWVEGGRKGRVKVKKLTGCEKVDNPEEIAERWVKQKQVKQTGN